MFIAEPVIEIIDSDDDSKLAYVLINNCKAPTMKAKIGDFCYVLEVIGRICNVKLDKTDCEAQ